VRRLDPAHASASITEPTTIDGNGHVRIHLPAQSVAFVQVDARRPPSLRPARMNDG
jgi:hypothetical protein